MEAIMLKDIREKTLGRGWILRFPGRYPYENVVELMIREEPDSPSGYALIVISGYNAGCTLVYLPSEAKSEPTGISTQWLLSNWCKWVYEHCQPEEVYCFRNQPTKLF